MKIKYKNFILEEDKYWYILSEIWLKEKWDNIWEEYIKTQIYPSTFERWIERIIQLLRINKTEWFELRWYIEEYDKMNKEFLEDLKDLINN